MSGNTVTLTLAGDGDQLSRALDQVGAAATRMGQQVGTTESAFDTAARSTGRFGAALDTMAGFSGQVADGLGGIGDAATATADMMSYSERKAEELAQAHQDVAQAAQDAKQAVADMEQALRDVAQAGIDAEQAQVDLEQALLDQATAQREYNAAVKEFGPNSAQARQAKLDLKQADIDAKQAAEDSKQANQDLKQANLDAAQAALDQKDAQNQLGKSQREVAEQSSALRKVGDYAGMASAVIGGLAGVIGLVTAVQWAWNIAMSANPIGLIVLAIGVLVAAIIYIATQTTWFQDLWKWAWGGIKDAALAVGRWFRDTLWRDWIMGAWNGIIDGGKAAWKWLSDLPGKLKGVFSKVADFISAPFRAAFNAISHAWNSTVGQLSWSVPSWVPGPVGGASIAAPKLPVFHNGGIMPGAPGQEGLAILEGGERITAANQVGQDRGIGPDDLRMPSGAGLDAMFLTWLQGLMRRSGMRLVKA
ncbi:hypothetical protein V6U90_08030 [Micromonospora sp. CPCC 206060]|uniref:hypothetical protein n=1 Tax=Micromonospora sp. CPCC 206060 TaxID=3122406 RepID=UPI002FF19B0B